MAKFITNNVSLFSIYIFLCSINNIENILTILNSLILCGDKYQNNQLYYEQQILKLLNQIIPVIYEVNFYT